MNARALSALMALVPLVLLALTVLILAAASLAPSPALRSHVRTVIPRLLDALVESTKVANQ